MVEKFYYSMGEITEMFDVEPSVIRYWCKQFSCLNPKRNAKGNRLFTAQDVERLKRIYHLLKEKRMTIEGAQKAMRKKNFVVEGDDADVKLLEQLQVLRAMLVEMRDSLGEPLPMEEIVVAEPTSEPVSELVSEPTSEPAEAVVEEVAEEVEVVAEQPTEEPTEEPAEEPAELSVDDIFEEGTKPEVEPTVEPTVEPIVEESVEVVAEPVAEPVAESEPVESATEETVPMEVQKATPKKKRSTRRKLIGEEGVVERPLFPFYEQTLF